MNTTIKFKHLLILVFIVAVGYTFSSITDESIWIGKTRLWDDVDSNYLKINRKISRTAGATLFDFNSQQFTWTIPGGLTLVHPVGDSMVSELMGIYRDTTISENTYTKSWILKRPYYNYFDSAAIYWTYYNPTGVIGKRDFWAINKLYAGYNDTLMVESSGPVGIPITGVTLPHGGLWEIKAYCNYFFKSATDADEKIDSVDFELIDPGSKTIDSVRIWHQYNAVELTADGGTAFLLAYYYGVGGSVSFNAISFMSSGSTILLKKGRVIATLIN